MHTPFPTYLRTRIPVTVGTVLSGNKSCQRERQCVCTNAPLKPGILKTLSSFSRIIEVPTVVDNAGVLFIELRFVWVGCVALPNRCWVAELLPDQPWSQKSPRGNESQRDVIFVIWIGILMYVLLFSNFAALFYEFEVKIPWVHLIARFSAQT